MKLSTAAAMSVEDLSIAAESLADKAHQIASDVEEIDMAAEAAQEELFDLRRRLQNEKDFTLRQQRELNKPVRCECPACGKTFDVNR